jgi:glycosyltransferase involved in cell wall biosynthesis
VPQQRFQVTTSEPRTLANLVARHKIIISSGTEYNVVAPAAGGPLQICDVADVPFEAWCERDARLRAVLSHADLILCGTPFQRDFMLGVAAGTGHLSPDTGAPRHPNELFAIVPYGHSGELPEPSRVIKGVVDGVGAKDKLVLWHAPSGELADPETAIAAMALLEERIPDVKLAFAGDAEFLGTPVMKHAREYATNSGLNERCVFFVELNDAAVCHMLLREADATVCCMRDLAEARFWPGQQAIESIGAQTPMVLTRGSYLAGLVEDLGLGLSVPVYDEQALAERLANLCETGTRTAFFTHLQQLHPHFAWDRAVLPLVEFLEDTPEDPATGRRDRKKNWTARVRLAMSNLFA